MKPGLLDLLACPHCHSGLEADSSAAEIVEGELSCSCCSRRWPVVGGIPRFVPSPAGFERKVADHFSNEFGAWADDDRDIDEPRLLEYYFFTRTGIDPLIYERIPGDPYRTSLPPNAYRPDPGFLEGKVVLDAGCGPGRFTTIAADAGAELVVGLDLGDHVDRAARRCRSRAVQIVQGSVLSPPFKPGVFDYVFSVGVLHHTGAARRAFEQLSTLVAPEGAISVWVYPPTYWGGRIRGPFNRFVHRRLAVKPPEVALRACERILYPIGRLQGWAGRRRWLKVTMAPLFLVSIPRHPHREIMISTIYDYFCPPSITTHSGAEVKDWSRAAGFHRVVELPVPTSVWAQR